MSTSGVMDARPGRDVIHRFATNPLVGLRDLPFRCSDIWNAGVVLWDGKYVLLMTIETLIGGHAIYKAVSDDGEHFGNGQVDAEPFMTGATDPARRPYESVGVRDARITPMDGECYITYVAEGDHGLRVGLARTKDFSDPSALEHLGYASQVDVRNAAMFSRKISDRYAMLKRPDPGGSIWLSYSRDLTYWGDESVVLTPRGGYWDATRTGPAAPPIEVEQGWLLIYYGEKHTSAGPLVRLGAAVLDRDDPSRVLARSNIPILSPRERYERIGDVPNVVYSCGALVEGDLLKIYYGASDSCICLGTAPLSEIVNHCMHSQSEF